MKVNAKNKAKYGFFIFTLIFSTVCILNLYISNCFYKAHPFYTASQFSKVSSLPTIIIDAGHGGEDGGTIGFNGVLEKHLNLEISSHLKELFTSNGFDVVMTRYDDALLYDRNEDYHGRKKALDLEARVKKANLYDNAIFISIHMNSYPQERYNGLQVYFSTKNSNSMKLAENIQFFVKLESDALVNLSIIAFYAQKDRNRNAYA